MTSSGYRRDPPIEHNRDGGFRRARDIEVGHQVCREAAARQVHMLEGVQSMNHRTDTGRAGDGQLLGPSAHDLPRIRDGEWAIGGIVGPEKGVDVLAEHHGELRFAVKGDFATERGCPRSDAAGDDADSLLSIRAFL